MNEIQIRLVRRSFQKILPQRFAESFYRNLFSIQPTLRLLFTDDFGDQTKKLMRMLETAIELLDEPEKLIPVLEESGCRHALYGVRDEYYETVGTALIKSLREMLAADFTPEVERAWIRLYEMISETMKRGAMELSLELDKIKEKNTENKFMNIINPKMSAISFIFIFFICASFSYAQTTAFTYKGKLNDGSTAATGSSLFEFKLFDTQTVGTGSQIGAAARRFLFSNPTRIISANEELTDLDFFADE